MDQGLDAETLGLMMDGLKEYLDDAFPLDRQLELDDEDMCPEDIVRRMCGDLGIQLLFIPEEYGGMGGGAVRRLPRLRAHGAHRPRRRHRRARHLPRQRPDPLRRHRGAEAALARRASPSDGLLMAYGATEPEAGSDLGALHTTAARIEEDGGVVGYRINGAKQWISNGGYRRPLHVLAHAPGGPTWFVVEKGTPGLSHGKPEDKHGIRASNTAALFARRRGRRGRPPGRRRRGPGAAAGAAGLRLHAPDGRRLRARRRLGGARPRHPLLDRAHPGRRAARREAGLHPQADRAARRAARGGARLHRGDRRAHRPGEADLNTEGAIAKYLATEAGNAAAEAAIQALGGYGYTREYLVEKIKRDVRITTIYEGTSEILEMTIARDRWQLHLKTRGDYYHAEARRAEELAARTPAGSAPPPPRSRCTRWPSSSSARPWRG